VAPTNIEIVKLILNYLNKSEDLIKYVKDRPGHDLRYSLNSSKIKRHLKWSCKYNFEYGIKKTIIWYIDKFNKKFFKNKNFQNRVGLKI
jgi:dTDP-glucose 4,6-dehydratase